MECFIANASLLEETPTMAFAQYKTLMIALNHEENYKIVISTTVIR